MNDELKNTTVITIAHRINTIVNCDKIAVLSEGRLVEYDSSEKLTQNPDSHFIKLLKDLKHE